MTFIKDVVSLHWLMKGKTMNVFEEMATTYSDSDSTRRLDWHADTTVLLAHAAEAYGDVGYYNNFHPGIVRDLAFAFKGKGIEVICGREGSVVMYLVIPEDVAEDVLTFAKNEMDADEINFVPKIWSEDDDERHFGDSKLLRIWWD